MDKKKLPFDIELMQKLGTEAGQEAIKRLLAKGIPVHGRKDGKIVTEYPDGRIEEWKGED